MPKSEDISDKSRSDQYFISKSPFHTKKKKKKKVVLILSYASMLAWFSVKCVFLLLLNSLRIKSINTCESLFFTV